jgi:hypothetical protein
VVSPAWRVLATEIGRWRDAGRIVDFWWRDDDATCLTPALARMLALAAEAEIPLALAVIPEGAEPQLFSALDSAIDVLQHGVDHRDRAAKGEKKTEFPANEPGEAALARLVNGKRRLAALAGKRSLAVLTPPWNRLSAQVLPRLAGGGFRGLSCYGARSAAQPVPGLAQVNTHIDLIAWKSGRGFIGEELALSLATRHLEARRRGTADPDEPTGWLTHHACHDEAAWTFLARLFEALGAEDGVRWRCARDLFGGAAPG